MSKYYDWDPKTSSIRLCQNAVEKKDGYYDIYIRIFVPFFIMPNTKWSSGTLLHLLYDPDPVTESPPQKYGQSHFCALQIYCGRYNPINAHLFVFRSSVRCWPSLQCNVLELHVSVGMYNHYEREWSHRQLVRTALFSSREAMQTRGERNRLKWGRTE